MSGKRVLKIKKSDQLALERLVSDNANLWHENLLLKIEVETTKSELVELKQIVLGGSNDVV